MKSDCPWFLHVVLDDVGDQVAFQVGHGDGVGARVGPVQVRVDPVDSQAVGRHDVLVDDNLLLVTLVDGGSGICLFINILVLCLVIF